MAVEQKVAIEEEESEENKTKQKQETTEFLNALLHDREKSEDCSQLHTVEEEKRKPEVQESSTDNESHGDKKSVSSDEEDNESGDEKDEDSGDDIDDDSAGDKDDDKENSHPNLLKDDDKENSHPNLLENLKLSFLGDYLMFNKSEKHQILSYQDCFGGLQPTAKIEGGKHNVKLKEELKNILKECLGDAVSKSGDNDDDACSDAEDRFDDEDGSTDAEEGSEDVEGSCDAEDGSNDDERSKEVEEQKEEIKLPIIDLVDDLQTDWLWAKRDDTIGLLDGKSLSYMEDANKNSYLGVTAKHWTDYSNEDILKQEEILREEARSQPLVGDKEPFSSLEAEYESGDPVMLKKIKMLSKKYYALRRTRGDGNCFFRGFLLSFMEHVLEKQDEREYDRVCDIAEKCKMILYQMGYAEDTFDVFTLFLNKFRSFLQGKYNSHSYEALLSRSRELDSDNDVKFLRLITSAEIQMHEEFWTPFIPELVCDGITIEQFCKNKVEKMGEPTDHIHIKALSDALGVSIRVVYIDRSLVINNGNLEVNKHDFIPTKYDDNNTPEESETNGDSNSEHVVCLLYRPEHYDILYPRQSQTNVEDAKGRM